MNKKLKQYVPYALALSLAGTALSAQAATTLRVAHFFPAASDVNQNLFKAWANAVEEDSNGQLRVQMFPSGTLAKADAIYEAAANGIADVGITVQGYTAGRFPLTQIVELPGIAPTASAGACVLQTLYDEGHLDDEYADTHPLFMFTTGPGFVHTKDTLVETPEDLAGLRIRRPTSLVGDMLTDMGATPVGMPAPDIYTSMQRGVIDGVSLPWEGIKTFRLNELATQHTQVPFYSLGLIATMNQRTYDRLSPEEKAAIDANSGMKWAENAGEVFNELDRQGKEEAVEAGHTILEIEEPLENPDWQGPLTAGIESYLGKLEERGLPAREVYQAAQAASNACTSGQ
ncbi:TRAP transporter substrate-binding protein [Marinobacter bohaiensis]|uniref:TRAP transporter substrate-binding protein n=1 Tax=Marinobacter bohaiensis TaxID=2201898 RepID=UPI000DADEF88|nr:TRAP transporter substrate-binding protein [Marinobacter bohaiensis]